PQRLVLENQDLVNNLEAEKITKKKLLDENENLKKEIIDLKRRLER
ncbi:2874_t:CDS:1, partial [Racocetra fulgida]